jgi:hypothetical protein
MLVHNTEPLGTPVLDAPIKVNPAQNDSVH